MTVQPYETQALLEQAWARQLAGRPDEAMALYREILQSGDQVQALIGLGQCQMEAKQAEAALDSFRRAAVLAPQSTVIRHMIDMLGGGGLPDRAPDDYLLWVFDGHAESFDAHLAALDYRGPQMIHRLVAGIWPEQPDRVLLDLGCGTGLNAPLFRRYASHIDGIDLAPRMLQQALRRGGYDGLYKAEAHAFLQRPPRRYDAVLATDVFIYIGRLEPLFTAAHAALNDGGELLFTVELGDDAEDVRLMPSGRFRQSDRHVRACAARTGFTLLATGDDVLRNEHGQAEAGRAYRLQKSA